MSKPQVVGHLPKAHCIEDEESPSEEVPLHGMSATSAAAVGRNDRRQVAGCPIVFVVILVIALLASASANVFFLTASAGTDSVLVLPQSATSVHPAGLPLSKSNLTGTWKVAAHYDAEGDFVLGQKGQRHSQWGQDWLAASVNGCKKSGFFIDLAANEAVLNSNSLMLERDFGWQGICIEANPKYYFELFHRKCKLFAGAVATSDTPVAFKLKNEVGGIVGEGTDNRPGAGHDGELKFHTVSLSEVLDRLGAPSRIDYFSLDIEGAESFAMIDFPWQRYRFTLLNVERPKPDLVKWLKDNGYVLLRDNPSWDATYIDGTIPEFPEIYKKWKGEGNINLPTSCMDELNYARPENKKWPR
ncbi:unnamed protein product [Polarella glacialis]|uniref:Methyltransferase FkbM domain-containing protein n=1 Tax=Polarella glacialis TaxID=89957 RepID=A0A813F226_POLGL|nr:unnamed protein product [Polarella glacialis]